MNIYRLLKLIIMVFPMFGLISAPVFADSFFENNNRDRYEKKYKKHYKQRIPKGYRYDRRYRHDRYYPPRGFRFHTLPRRHYQIRYRSGPYFYSNGIWYRRTGAHFVVTIPPFGIVVPFLPNFYTTLWVRGVPYYYANDVYYVWQPDRNGYVVTNPPQDINEEETRPLAEQLFIYPKQGQSEKKQADDRFACHQWSAGQTDYDPSKPAENIKQSELSIKYENYQKAMKACLEGRGYSVR